MTETQLQSAIQSALQRLGYVVLRLNSGSARRRGYRIRLCPEGTPDLLVLLRAGRVLWIEVKLPGESLSAAQDEWRHRAAREGHLVVVVHSAATAIAAVRRA